MKGLFASSNFIAVALISRRKRPNRKLFSDVATKCAHHCGLCPYRAREMSKRDKN